MKNVTVRATTVAAILVCGTALAEREYVLKPTSEGRLQAINLDGAIVWEVDCPDGCREVETTPDGYIILDRYHIVDRIGSVHPFSFRTGRDELVSTSSLKNVNGLMWENIVSPITGSMFGGVEAPLFDSQGNAWLIVSARTGDDHFVNVVVSNGHSNVWSPSETIVSTTDDIQDGAITIDGNDVITVAYRRIAATINNLDIVRYVPGQGWSASQTIYATEDFFQQVDAVADADGNVIVAFDGDSRDAMWTVIYDAATDTWGPASRFSPAQANDVDAPTLIRNKNGTVVYATFWIESAPDPFPGIFISRFNSATASFDPLRKFPRTLRAEHPFSGNTASHLPSAVDPEGNVTTVFYTSQPFGNDTRWIMWASRLKANGMMRFPRPLMVHLDREAELTSASDIAASDAGDVLLAFGRFEEGVDHMIMALRYDAQTDSWDSPQTLLVHDTASGDRPSVGFLGDHTAMVVYKDRSFLQPAQLQSVFFDGANWLLDEVLPVSSNPLSPTPYEVVVDGVDVLLALDEGSTDTTWLFGAGGTN